MNNITITIIWVRFPEPNYFFSLKGRCQFSNQKWHWEIPNKPEVTSSILVGGTSPMASLLIIKGSLYSSAG